MQLDTHCPLAEDDVRVVVGRDETRAGFENYLVGEGLALGGRAAAEIDACAVSFCGGYLLGHGDGGHDDVCVDGGFAGCEGECLGVVTYMSLVCDFS